MKNKGITLIALVVTIVVLLILAGITISLVFGSNGVINKAQEANENTKIAQVREQLELAKGTNRNRRNERKARNGKSTSICRWKWLI